MDVLSALAPVCHEDRAKCGGVHEKDPAGTTALLRLLKQVPPLPPRGVSNSAAGASDVATVGDAASSCLETVHAFGAVLRVITAPLSSMPACQ